MTGYVNGSDVLCKIGSGQNAGAIGHCTSHTATYNTETKDIAVKPLASVDASAASFWKNKRIVGLSMQVKVEGMKFYSETESGFVKILGAWKSGQSIQLSLFERENDTAPYASGNFVISSLEESNPAGDDATYNATFDNDGAITIDETKLDLLAASSGSGSGNGSGNGSQS